MVRGGNRRVDVIQQCEGEVKGYEKDAVKRGMRRMQ